MIIHSRAAMLVSLVLLMAAAFVAGFGPAVADDQEHGEKSHKESIHHFKDFQSLPVLHDGRVKPLDTLARNELKQFSGKDHLEDRSAISWMAETLFDPGSSVNTPVFKIENADVRHLLELEERKKPLYSYIEISAGLEKTFPLIEELLKSPKKSMSPEQKSLLEIHENALEYTQLLRSFSLLLPLNISVPYKWAKEIESMDHGKVVAPDTDPDDQVTYLMLKKIDQPLVESVKSVIANKGDDPSKYTPEEQATAMLSWQIRTIEDAAENNTLLKVIPDPNKDGEWVSPWELVRGGKGSPATAATLEQWSKLANSWQTGSDEEWRDTLKNLAHPDEMRMATEILYNKARPFHIALLAFAASFALALLALSLNSGRRFWIISAIGAALLALMAQGAGLACRIFLLERPPVGTLYESILFVGAVAPLFALALEHKLKNGLGVLLCGSIGILVGLLGMTMADEGDTMKVLAAVLNTQFWLATHVLCITIGYGWCLVTSIVAHALLIGKAARRMTDAQIKTLETSLGTLALTALLFTATGTILGGIWADQSWGRFWGWDPKENGALLIVLWLVWIIHGKIAGQISMTVYTMGMAFVSAIVGAAWIGVNLLGVGLHSYGFTEGLFWGLGIFTVIEAVVIGLLGWAIRRASANSPSSSRPPTDTKGSAHA